MPTPPPSPEERPSTVLETDEDIRRALHDGRAVPKPRPPAASDPYRPTLRPPIAILTVMDDGKSEGETIHVRAERFVIGRTEGDLLIPHDGLISGRHVEILRQQVAGRYRWVITDLQTRNGLFIRVSRTTLTHGTEILVGRGRYRFERPGSGLPETVDDPGGNFPSGSTGGWAEGTPLLQPFLAEVTARGSGARLPLVGPEAWIGSEPSCQIVRRDDPFAEARHVRLSVDGKGAWQAQNNKTANGLWCRVPQITVDDACLFQIGEQRFRLKIGQ